MTTCFALGGGEIAERETEPIDRAVIDATGVADPHVLFLPTASADADEYIETFEAYYGDALGCSTDCLAVARGGPDEETIRGKLDAADAVYVGGGDTGYMLDTWRTRGIDRWLRDAWRDGTVMAGLSAGALCWFAGGVGDAVALDGVSYGPVDGLGFVSGLHATVHATQERRAALLNYLAVRNGVGIALENNAAFEVRDDEWRVHTSSPNAVAFHLHAAGEDRSVVSLPVEESYRSMAELL